MLAEQLTRQLIRLSPHGEPAPTEVLDLLVRHADVVFDAASTKVDERSGVSAKQRLAQYLREELVAAERWDDVIELMTRATEAFPHDRSYAVALVRGFYEMGHFEEAQTEAEHALLEEPDPVLVKLQVAALEGLGRSEDADEAMLAGCYRSGDFELWRDLAARRFRHEDIDGAMRALAVARRLLSRMKGSVVRQWEARLHKGRATGLYRLERYQEAAIELLAGLDAERNHGQEPDPDLAALKERFPAEQPDAWAEAEAAMADGTIVEKLGEMLMAERNRELELGLRPAYFVFVDTDKGFGYLVLGTPPADEPTEPSEVQAEDRVYVSLRTITGKTEGLAAGDRVQALTTPISVADARQIGANRRAVFVRISAASAS